MPRKPLSLIATLLLVLVAVPATAATVTLYYPDQRRADFSIDVPEYWDLEQAEEEGGFFTVTGPTGVELSFRTIRANDADIDASIEQSIEWVFDNFDDVDLDEPEDIIQNGMEGFNMTGTVTDRDSGDTLVLVMAWLGLKRSHLAEVMLLVDPSDKRGLNAAERVIKTLRAAMNK